MKKTLFCDSDFRRIIAYQNYKVTPKKNKKKTTIYCQFHALRDYEINVYLKKY